MRTVKFELDETNKAINATQKEIGKIMKVGPLRLRSNAANLRRRQKATPAHRLLRKPIWRNKRRSFRLMQRNVA